MHLYIDGVDLVDGHVFLEIRFDFPTNFHPDLQTDSLANFAV